MKYVSIDIETTGLNHSFCQMIEFGAVIDDLCNPKAYCDLPKFHCYIARERYVGETYALAMHGEIFRRIAKREQPWDYIRPEDLRYEFTNFLRDHGLVDDEKSRNENEINVTGKNFAKFDLRFLENEGLTDIVPYTLSHRILDPGSLYFNPMIDKKLPDSKTCMKRAGMDGEVSHTALEDALMVIRLIRRHYKLEG